MKKFIIYMASDKSTNIGITRKVIKSISGDVQKALA